MSGLRSQNLAQATLAAGPPPRAGTPPAAEAAPMADCIHNLDVLTCSICLMTDVEYVEPSYERHDYVATFDENTSERSEQRPEQVMSSDVDVEEIEPFVRLGWSDEFDPQVLRSK